MQNAYNRIQQWRHERSWASRWHRINQSIADRSIRSFAVGNARDYRRFLSASNHRIVELHAAVPQSSPSVLWRRLNRRLRHTTPDISDSTAATATATKHTERSSEVRNVSVGGSTAVDVRLAPRCTSPGCCLVSTVISPSGARPVDPASSTSFAVAITPMSYRSSLAKWRERWWRTQVGRRAAEENTSQ